VFDGPGNVALDLEQYRQIELHGAEGAGVARGLSAGDGAVVHLLGLFDTLDRVYVNDLARKELGWRPQVDFASALARLKAGQNPFSDLKDQIGKKGYHDEVFDDGPFPVD
jgi:UDP-glucose 4-epimerase